VVIAADGRLAHNPFSPLDRIVAHSPAFLHRPPFMKTKHRAMPSVKSSPFRTEELRYELRRLPGSLDHGEVAGILDCREPRFGDPARGRFRRLPRKLDVVSTGEDERGCADSSQVRGDGSVPAAQCQARGDE